MNLELIDFGFKLKYFADRECQYSRYSFCYLHEAPIYISSDLNPPLNVN